MVSKKYWGKLVSEFADLLNQIKEKETIEILGVPFQILPGVFSPVYSSETAWFAEQIIPLIKDKKFLEIGSGAGVIACLASIHGASSVIATDINPKCVENTRLNAELHSLNICVREGSVFDPIAKNELFDIIFWNHPFSDEKPKEDDAIHALVFDENHKFLTTFLEKGKTYLTKNGRLILGSSNVARVQLIKKIAQEAGYVVTLLQKVDFPVDKEKKVKMDLRIYSFQSKSE